MRCPFCRGMDNNVIDSRIGRDGASIRRRRECRQCGRRFTSYERVEEVVPLIIKRDGRREPFDRAKLIEGLRKACEKRPVSIHDIETFVDRLESQLQERAEHEVPTTFIGSESMRFLRGLDLIAYVRFASVYQSFRTVGDFLRALEELRREEEEGGPAPTAADSLSAEEGRPDDADGTGGGR